MKEIISVLLLTSLSLYSVTFSPLAVSISSTLADTTTNETPPLAIQVPTEENKGVVEAEKAKIVADVTTEEKKVGKVTTRIGLGGASKPIPKITGDTVDDRAKSLLNSVGLGHTLPTWKSLGEKYKIDYTLPMAIAFADSHMGKALKSTNNIGNVGNNDRGDVKHYETLDEGIEAIFWSLAHGKYMSGHTIVGTLSGEGRKRLGLPGCAEEKNYRQKCYATSMGVWSTNVTNAMSAMHNKQITETYFFRT